MLTLERRNSARSATLASKVREMNGEYLYSWSAANISEEGLFLLNKTCYNSQDHFSKLTFTLPDGTILKDITARIVRENSKGSPKGCAFEFMNLSEDNRIALKRFLMTKAAS